VIWRFLALLKESFAEERDFQGIRGYSSDVFLEVAAGKEAARESLSPALPSARMSPTRLSLGGLHPCIARFCFT